MINVQNISSKLASLPDQALKQYAEMHKEDPYVFSLALSESNRRKQMRSQGQQAMPQPRVVDKELEDMDMRLPEDLGIARIPVDMNMASGGIVAFDDGGMTHYARGGNAGEGFSNDEDSDAFKFALSNTLSLEGGLNKDDKVGGLTKYGISQKAYPKLDIAKLTPADAKAIYKRDYWDKIGGDEIAAKDPKLAALMFDTAVQHGVSGAKDMFSQAGNDPAKLLQVRSEKLQSLVQDNPEKYGSQAKGWSNRIAKLAYTLAPGSTAQAATQTDVAAPPQEADRSVMGQLRGIGQGIAGIPTAIGNVVSPQGAGGYTPGTRNFFERSADVVGIPENYQRNISNTLNALPGVSVLRAPAAVGKLSAAAQATREAEIAAAAQKAAAAEAKVANLRLPAPPAKQGIAAIPPSPTAPPVAPRTTFPLSPESVEMNQKMQATKQAQAMRNLEADKAAAEAARTGVTTAKDAAKTSEAIEMANAARAANAANKVITPTNKTLATAREVQAGRNLDTAADQMSLNSDNTAFKPDYQPDTSRGYPAPVSPAVDDRTKRDPANYKPEEKKQIIEAAKDAVPPNKDTDGWSKNDWLQFGLALMAGKSSNALTNVGEAGLSLLASKQARESEKNKLDLYKAVHAEKPGQSIQIAERLMAADKTLSFEDALAKATALTGGATKEALSDTRAEQVRIQNLRNFNAAKDKLDEKYSPLLMSGNSPTSKGMRAKYEADLQALREIHSIPTNTGPVATAASASGWGVPQKQ